MWISATMPMKKLETFKLGASGSLPAELHQKIVI
jgi:hypothetical protein